MGKPCRGIRVRPRQRSPFPFEALDKVSNRIVNEVKGVNRVLYDITSKPPATVEFE